MSYSLEIHPHVSDDVMEIFLYIDETSPRQANRFVESVLEEYNRLLSELNNRIFLHDKKFVKYRSVGKFKRHLIFYTVQKKQELVEILSVQYGGRDSDLIGKIINGRLEG